MESLISLSKVAKSFVVGSQVVPVLKDVNLSINRGDFAIIVGPSGCGKSTLLHTMLGLEKPTAGEAYLGQHNLYQNTTEDDRSSWRQKYMGVVYQQSNWIKALNVRENVAFPLLLTGKTREEGLMKAQTKLKEVGMENWAFYIPTELSSGQQQRVALARALITDPELLIADEPTGNLDFKNGVELMEFLVELNTTQKKTIIMVTHDLEYLKYAKRAIRMFSGEIVGEYTGSQKDKLMRTLEMPSKEKHVKSK